MMKKSLIIPPHGVEDLGDVLAIARADGKKVFRTKRPIRVLPEVVKRGYGYLVVVEYDGMGDTNNLGQGKDDE